MNIYTYEPQYGMTKCNNCKQEFTGLACMKSYACAYATTSISKIDKEYGYHTSVGGIIESVNLAMID